MTDSKMLLPLHTDTAVFCLRRLDTRGVENFFVCYGNKPGRHFARNLREFGVARLEELEVNQ